MESTDNNTPENLLDAAKAMYHSEEMQLAAYQKTLKQPTSEIDSKIAAELMHHSESMQTQVYLSQVL